MQFPPNRERAFKQPDPGYMWIGVLGDGLVKPVPQVAPRGLDALARQFAADRGEGASIVTIPQREFPELHHAYYRNGQFEFVPVVQPPRVLAPLNVDEVVELIAHFMPDSEVRPNLERAESELTKAQEALKSAEEPEGGGEPSSVDDLGGMPQPFGEPAREGDGIPPDFRGLMMPNESPEKFTERMRRRWQYLQHLRIDGTKPTDARALPDMTEEESAELADLEERNKRSGGQRWLD